MFQRSFWQNHSASPALRRTTTTRPKHAFYEPQNQSSAALRALRFTACCVDLAAQSNLPPQRTICCVCGRKREESSGVQVERFGVDGSRRGNRLIWWVETDELAAAFRSGCGFAGVGRIGVRVALDKSIFGDASCGEMNPEPAAPSGLYTRDRTAVYPRRGGNCCGRQEENHEPPSKRSPLMCRLISPKVRLETKTLMMLKVFNYFSFLENDFDEG